MYLTWYPSFIVQIRFRHEARVERMGGGSAPSPVQRAFNTASSSVIIMTLMIVGLLGAMIACLPILLLIKIASTLYSFTSSCYQVDDVDSSVRPYSPPNDSDESPYLERLLLSLMGSPSLSCTNSTTCKYEMQCITPLLSN